jgi:ribosomal protein S18 acetylase RimI-like enzyme
MTEKEFALFLEHDIEEYARSQVRAGYWSETEAPHRSRREHRSLLPDGMKSRYHHFYTIRESEQEQAVGALWFRANLDSARPSGFVFTLEIYEPFRRKGYARRAALELEKVAREMGLKQLVLRLFAYNEAARDLFEGQGYKIASLDLLKDL